MGVFRSASSSHSLLILSRISDLLLLSSLFIANLDTRHAKHVEVRLARPRRQLYTAVVSMTSPSVCREVCKRKTISTEHWLMFRS